MFCPIALLQLHSRWCCWCRRLDCSSQWEPKGAGLFIGLVTGVLSGLLGVGGGVVMVPAMMMLLHVEGVIAKGTSLAVIIPTAAMGTWRNRSKNNVDMRAAGVVAASGIVAAVAGGWIAARMSDSLSNFLFATLLIVVAVRLLFQARRDRRNNVTVVVE